MLSIHQTLVSFNSSSVHCDNVNIYQLRKPRKCSIKKINHFFFRFEGRLKKLKWWLEHMEKRMTSDLLEANQRGPEKALLEQVEEYQQEVLKERCPSAHVFVGQRNKVHRLGCCIEVGLSAIFTLLERLFSGQFFDYYSLHLKTNTCTTCDFVSLLFFVVFSTSLMATCLTHKFNSIPFPIMRRTTQKSTNGQHGSPGSQPWTCFLFFFLHSEIPLSACVRRRRP